MSEIIPVLRDTLPEDMICFTFFGLRFDGADLVSDGGQGTNFGFSGVAANIMPIRPLDILAVWKLLPVSSGLVLDFARVGLRAAYSSIACSYH